jgi:hypothetical protein
MGRNNFTKYNGNSNYKRYDYDADSRQTRRIYDRLSDEFPLTATTSDEADDESANNTLEGGKQKKEVPIKEVYVKDLETTLLLKLIPVLVPMEWKIESENLTDDDAVDMRIHICINKHKKKHKKEKKGKMIKYNDTADKEYNYNRIFTEVAYALIPACPGTTARGTQESMKIIKMTDRRTYGTRVLP